MKRHFIAGLLAFLLIGKLCIGAGAFTYAQELFTIDIPEQGKVYYYTDRGTNMDGTMLENAQKQDVLCLIGRYNESGKLLYTFKVEQRSGTAAETAAALQETLAAAYELGDPTAETVSGWEGLCLSGRSVKNENYKVRLWVCGDEPAVVITAMYQPEIYDMVLDLLDTIQWSWMIQDDPQDVASTEPPDELNPQATVAEPTEEAEIPPVTETPNAPGAMAQLEPVSNQEEDETGRLTLVVDLVLSNEVCFIAGAAVLAGVIAVTISIIILINISRGNYWPRHSKHPRRRGHYHPQHIWR